MILLYRIQCELGKFLFQLGFHTLAIRVLLPTANAGLPEAQMIVGFAYLNGKAVATNDR